MNNSDVNLVKENKNKNPFFIIIGITIVIILFGLIYGYGYHSTDFKSDQQIENYLVKYMNDKYNTNVTLSLKEKKLISICTFNFDGCISYAKNSNIYKYEYTGVDDENNKFVISYTNNYIGRYKKHDSKIVENYKKYDEKDLIEEIVYDYSDRFDIYIKTEDADTEEYDANYLIVRMLVDEIDLKNILSLKEELEAFDTVSNIIITTDKDVYNKAISSNNNTCSGCEIFTESGFVHPNVLSKQLGYTFIKKNKNVSHYFFDEINQIGINNKNNYYTLIVDESSIYVYQKHK